MDETSAIKASKLQVQYIIDRLKNSSFVRNVLVVMTGTAIAQVVGIALTPVISRLFTPADFGIFGSFNSVATIIAAGATLQYSQAIMLPKEKEDALNLFFVSGLSTIAVSVLCLSLCLLLPEFIQGVMKTSGTWILALLVLSTVISGLNNSCQAWCVRVKAFKQTSASQAIRSLSSSGAQIGFGIIKGGAAGLIVSSIFADILASINLVIVLKRDVVAGRSFIRWERMKALAIEYRDFPMYSASQNVINALSSGLPVLLLTHYYGIIVAGTYAFGARILQVPMGFVLGALRQVLFQKAGETQHQGGKLAPLYVKITTGLFALAFMPSLILIIWAPEIFAVVFGLQWYTAGEYASYLVLWMVFVFCNVPADLFARLIRIQRTIFIYDLILLAVRVSVLVICGFYLSALQSIIVFSIVGAAMNLCLILLVGYTVMKKEGQVSWGCIKNSLMDR